MGAKALPDDGCSRSSRRTEPTTFETLTGRNSSEVLFNEINNIVSVLRCVGNKSIKDCGPRNTRPVSLSSATSDKISIVVLNHCLNCLRHNPPNELSYRITCKWFDCRTRIFFKEECEGCIEAH